MWLIDRLRDYIRSFSRPHAFSEAQLFYLDDLFVPDPDRPGCYTKESVIAVIQQQLAWGFDVKPGIIGGDGFGAEIDEAIIAEAKSRPKLPP